MGKIAGNLILYLVQSSKHFSFEWYFGNVSFWRFKIIYLYCLDSEYIFSQREFESQGHPCLAPQMCFEWFTKGQHDLESDVQQQLFKEKILKLESYEITMNGRKTKFTFSVLKNILFFPPFLLSQCLKNSPTVWNIFVMFMCTDKFLFIWMLSYYNFLIIWSDNSNYQNVFSWSYLVQKWFI